MQFIKEKKEKNKESLKPEIKLFLDETWKSFISNKIIAWLTILSFLVNIANWLSLAIFVKPVEGNIILHYNVYFGVDMMGNWKQVYFLPGIGIILLVINLFLAFYFYKKKERIASHIFMIATLMAQLSLLVAAASVIIINY